MTVSDSEYSPLPIRQPKVSSTFRDDGSIVIEQDYDLPVAYPSIPWLLLDRAARHPDRWLVARRQQLADGKTGDWIGASYGEVAAKAKALAQWMLDAGFGPDKPVAVLSGSSAEHLIVNFAAQMARAPYIPVSVNFSTHGGDFDRLRHVFSVCRPALAFADDAAVYSPALEAVADGLDHVIAGNAALEALLHRPVTAAVDASIAAITPDTVAKYIFTSGSTGKPKGVIQTQRMMTAIIAQHDALYIRDEEHGQGDAYLSWMAWSHVGPSNVMMGDVLNDGATLYIDDGRPVEGMFEETIRNLREIHPVEYGSAPIFFSHLTRAMERDPALRDAFFSRLKYMNYSTAGLSQDLFDRLQAQAIAATGRKVPIITKYGSTETQGMTLTSWPMEKTGPIGLPFPGITLKLSPVGDKLEIRVKGDTVTPGYLHNPEATARAFDEEGFYCTGDAGVLADPDRPELGIVFDGRVSENFKMASGTWVSVGQLRLDLVRALAPLVEDLVIVGENRDVLGAMLWLRNDEARKLVGDEVDPAVYLTDPSIQAHLRDAALAFNAGAGGMSRRIARLLILGAPPKGDEIAEKGYINQRGVQKNRPDEVERLYTPAIAPHVIEIEKLQ